MTTNSKLLVGLSIVLTLLVLGVVVYAVFVLTSLERFANYWDKQNQSPPVGDALVVVALGDSTVQGIGATSPMKGFVGQFAGKVATDQKRAVQINNFSKSGAAASHVLENQIPKRDVLNRADLIVIAVGPNDMIQKIKKDKYFKDYQQILNRLPKEKVIIANIPPLVRSTVSDESVKEWNTDLDVLAEKNNVRVAPIYEAIKPRSLDPRIYSIDLFHPNNTGYGLWAEAFYSQVGPILEFPEVIQ